MRLGYSTPEFTFQVQWSKEDELFIGKCIEYPLLATHGKNPTDALEEIMMLVNHVNNIAFRRMNNGLEE